MLKNTALALLCCSNHLIPLHSHWTNGLKWYRNHLLGEKFCYSLQTKFYKTNLWTLKSPMWSCMSNIWPPQISPRAQKGKLADLWSAGFTYTSLHVCTRWLYETELTFFAMLQPLCTYELLFEMLSCFFLLKNDALLHSVVHWENRRCKKTADEGMARSTRGPKPPSSDRNLHLGAMPPLHLVRSRKGSIYWDRWEEIGRAALNSSSASSSALKTWDTCRHSAAEPELRWVNLRLSASRMNFHIELDWVPF